MTGRSSNRLDAEDWRPAISRSLDGALRKGWHGTLRIEIVDGVVKRLLVERSIKDPAEVRAPVAPEDGPSVG